MALPPHNFCLRTAVLFVRYAIDLPADYDMSRIDARVAAKSEHWDRRAGLSFKAFTVAERATGARHNRYAPFYVWSDPAAFTDFLTGAEYAGLADGFGPVRIHTAQVLALTLGSGATPAFARFESRPVAPTEDLATVHAEELATHQAAVDADATATRVCTLDPSTWTVHRLVLTTTPQELRIVHLARPAGATVRR